MGSHNPESKGSVKEVLRCFKLRSEEDLDKELLLQPHFTLHWKEYRKHRIFAPGARDGSKGPTHKTIAEDLAREIEEGIDSRYLHLPGAATDTTSDTEAQHQIRLGVRVACDTRRSNSRIMVYGPGETVMDFARGLLLLVRILRYQYLPTRRGSMAKRLDFACGKCIHTRAQEMWRNPELSDAKYDNLLRQIVYAGKHAFVNEVPGVSRVVVHTGADATKAQEATDAEGQIGNTPTAETARQVQWITNGFDTCVEELQEDSSSSEIPPNPGETEDKTNKMRNREYEEHPLFEGIKKMQDQLLGKQHLAPYPETMRLDSPTAETARLVQRVTNGFNTCVEELQEDSNSSEIPSHPGETEEKTNSSEILSNLGEKDSNSSGIPPSPGETEDKINRKRKREEERQSLLQDLQKCQDEAMSMRSKGTIAKDLILGVEYAYQETRQEYVELFGEDEDLAPFPETIGECE